LQAYDTHAATPSGLDGPKQLTSAYDLALIGRADLARADFRRYTAQRLGTVPAQTARYRAFQFANDNKLLYNYPGAFGGKNGFTDAAHHSFIGAAKHGNRRLIVTMMYGEHKPDNIAAQAGRLLDWGFALPRTAPPVGMLVAPGSATPTPSASPTASPTAAAASRADTAGSGSATPAIAMLGVAALTVLLIALATRVLRRRARP
jgi:D-alanyl-D-alanine carboxypeptidase (penicillin-binding protein 5/6)